MKAHLSTKGKIPRRNTKIQHFKQICKHLTKCEPIADKRYKLQLQKLISYPM